MAVPVCCNCAQDKFTALEGDVESKSRSLGCGGGRRPYWIADREDEELIHATGSRTA